MTSHEISFDIETDSDGNYTETKNIGIPFGYLDEIKLDIPVGDPIPTTASITITDPLPGKKLLELSVIPDADTNTFYRVRPSVQAITGDDITDTGERYMIKSPSLTVKITGGGNGKNAKIRIWVTR